MMLPPPVFWQDPNGASHPFALLLAPVARLYGFIGQRQRQRAIPWLAPGPVICIGNVSMGGVGKTPFALKVGELLKAQSLSPAYLTRGFGGQEKGPLFVSSASTACTVGDEALLLAQGAQTCVAHDRVAGARHIFEANPRAVVIMDDGYQNPSLAKDFSVLLVDGETGFGNGAVFPCGPLRETPESARQRADAIVFVLPRQGVPVPQSLLAYAAGVPTFRAWLAPVEAPVQGDKAFAFCGIGRPEKFYRTAREAGYELVGQQDFADHYAYKAQDLSQLAAKAKAAGARLLTTMKDYMRLPTEFRTQVTGLPVAMQLDNEAGFQGLMGYAISKDQTDE